MKVAFYINAIHEGGAERVVVNLASDFAEYGDEIILITSFRDKWEYPYSDKIKRYILDENKVYNNVIIKNISRIKRLHSILKSECPDCIVSFMAEANFRSIIASFGMKTKTIVSVRNDPKVEYPGKVRGFFGRHMLNFADGCVFQTKDAQDWFYNRLKSKSTIILNSVKKDFFEIERKQIDNTIVTCGRLEEQKNQKLLVEAFELVEKVHSGAKLFIYGEGRLRTELELLIKNKGLEKKIFLCGNYNNIPEVLSWANIFVLSSDYEGMPNALMEALAAGIPSISTDCPCGGPEFLISNKINGMLTTVGDMKQLANSIIYLLNNKKTADKMGVNAKKKAYDFYPDKINNEWHRYIEEVVGIL